LNENPDGIRQDWPRIPLPASKEQLETSAAIGQQIADLLNVDKPVLGVSAGTIRPEFRVMGSIHPVNQKSWRGEGEELAVTAAWGYVGRLGVTMPGKGKSDERKYSDAERAAIETGTNALSVPAKDAFARLGKSTYDIYLNGGAYWCNVPSGVWNYFIGGYQVIKKWLSYRERNLLGRPLTTEEVR